MIIKKKVQDALNGQVNAELHAGYLYLSMSAWFEGQGFKGFAKWMQTQAEEEKGHAMKIYNYVFERGGNVALKAIEKPKGAWKSALDAFEDAYKHEQKVTNMIDALVALSEKEKDNATKQFLQWYVSEQVEEEDTCREIIDKLKLIKNAPGGLFIMDKELGARG